MSKNFERFATKPCKFNAEGEWTLSCLIHAGSAGGPIRCSAARDAAMERLAERVREYEKGYHIARRLLAMAGEMIEAHVPDHPLRDEIDAFLTSPAEKKLFALLDEVREKVVAEHGEDEWQRRFKAAMSVLSDAKARA